MINQNKFGQKLIPRIKKVYKAKIRNPITQHRELQAKKFQTRIDYVDLSAFGVGVEFDDFDNYKADCDQIDKTIQKYCCKYGRLVQKLEDIDKKLDQFMHQICAMADRYDDRILMMLGLSELDPYQKELIFKMYQSTNMLKQQQIQKSDPQDSKVLNINVMVEEESCDGKISASPEPKGLRKKDTFVDRMKKVYPT